VYVTRQVAVYYSGFLKSGKKFDHSTKGPGFKFKLGAGRVIKGWDLGVAGMKV
jgi:FKBP-type peptidyl-prolyl cis-trans isomerase